MKKKKIILALMLLLPILGFSIEGNTKKYDNLKGKRYRDINTLNEFNGYDYFGGAMISDDEDGEYAYGIYSKGEITLVVLEKIASRDNEGKVLYEVADILEISGVTDKDLVTFSQCRLNQEYDGRIIAVIDRTKVENSQEEFTTDIIKAWRVDLQKEEIKEIPKNGIDCNNEYAEGDEYYD